MRFHHGSFQLIWRQVLLEVHYRAWGGVWLIVLYQTFGGSTLCWWIIFFTSYRWWSVMPLTNAQYLNSYRDSYVRHTKVEICVAWIVHFHLCLLGYACCLLTCWSSCYMFLEGKGITKVCAIWLWFGVEHVFSSWPLGNMCQLFNAKLHLKG